MKEKYPEGFYVPIHKSLVQQLYWLGVPRNIFLGEFFFGIFGGIILQSFFIVFVIIGIHFILAYLAKKDPLFHLVFLRARKQEKFYRC